jgi:hypothetical protein
MRANEQSLTISFDTYETISFSKALSRFEWGGETVTESGLAHMQDPSTTHKMEFLQDPISSTRVWDEVYQEKSGFDYMDLCSLETTSNHNGKGCPGSR